MPRARAGGVARYLRPEAEAVRFWPRPELGDLLGWVAAEQRVAVGLVTGPGGSGKTRLVRELGEQAARQGWVQYWVPAGHEAAAVAAAREGDDPVLLVVDYAETCTGCPACWRLLRPRAGRRCGCCCWPAATGSGGSSSAAARSRSETCCRPSR
jgi:hypothetical protein